MIAFFGLLALVLGTMFVLTHEYGLIYVGASVGILWLLFGAAATIWISGTVLGMVRRISRRK